MRIIGSTLLALALSAGWGAALGPRAQAQDIAALLLFKAVWYAQTSTNDPALIPQASDPYDLTAYAYLTGEFLQDPDNLLFIQGVTLRTPAGATKGMQFDEMEGGFAFYEGAVSEAALNQRYGAGTYRFTETSLIFGTVSYNVSLGPDDYPPAPKVTNFTEAQNVDPTKPFVLRWVEFSGSGERTIAVRISESPSGAQVFAPDVLPGTETLVVVPPNTLEPGRDYYVEIRFTRFSQYAPSGSPEIYTGWDANNALPLRTRLGGNPDPPAILSARLTPGGDLELSVRCTPGRPLKILGAATLAGPWTELAAANPGLSPAVFTLPKAQLGAQMFLRALQE